MSPRSVVGMGVEGARFQADLPDGLTFALALDFTQQTPTATVVDDESATNRPALVSEISFDLQRGAASLVLWG